jgi:hypothetical protein
MCCPAVRDDRALLVFRAADRSTVAEFARNDPEAGSGKTLVGKARTSAALSSSGDEGPKGKSVVLFRSTPGWLLATLLRRGTGKPAKPSMIELAGQARNRGSFWKDPPKATLRVSHN